MKILLAMSLAVFLSHCGSKEPAGPIRAKIVTADVAGFDYKVVEFKYLEDVRHADGVIAAIRGNGVINNDAPDSDVLSGDPDKLFKKKGDQVVVDYYVDKGVVIAQNFESLAILTLYYDFEQIIDFWITNYKFTLKQFPKFNIFYDPQIHSSKGGVSVTVTQRLNASYVPGLGDLMVWKTSRLEDVPLKMNPAVLAHEFGHKIFDILFAKEDASFVYNSDVTDDALYQIKGINEGLADFMSWLFLQRIDLFLKSLPTFVDRVVPVPWTSSVLIKNKDVCKGSFYCKGSVLNSALNELAVDASMTPHKVGTAVLSALPKFALDWKAHRSDKNFDYFYLLNRIAAELPKSEKTLACSIFKTWFDDATNSKGLDSCL